MKWGHVCLQLGCLSHVEKKRWILPRLSRSQKLQEELKYQRRRPSSPAIKSEITLSGLDKTAVGLSLSLHFQARTQKCWRKTTVDDIDLYGICVRSEEYKNRYKRGMLFYLRDEIVVGMMFWNVPPVDDRYMAATEVRTLLYIRISYITLTGTVF